MRGDMLSAAGTPRGLSDGGNCNPAALGQSQSWLWALFRLLCRGRELEEVLLRLREGSYSKLGRKREELRAWRPLLLTALAALHYPSLQQELTGDG